MKQKTLPEFTSEDQERKFWATADSTQYVNWPSGMREKFVNLKPSLRTTSVRLPKTMIET
jgi:hypothetical protein